MSEKGGGKAIAEGGGGGRMGNLRQKAKAGKGGNCDRRG